MLRLRLDWIDRDGKLLILAGCVHAVAIGLAGVVSVSDLIDGGSFPTWRLALFVWGGILSLPLMLSVLLFAEKVGRRRLLVVLTLMSAAAVAALVLTSNILLLLPFVFLGSLSRGGDSSHPIRALWMASLADTAPPHKRTDLYAVYHIALEVYSFFGALASITVTLFGAIFLWVLFDLNGAYLTKALLISSVLSVLLLLFEGFLYSRLSPGVEAPAEARKPVNPFKLPSRRLMFKLSGLLGLNALAMNLILSSVAIHSSINWSEEGWKDTFLTSLSAVTLSAVFVLPALWLAAKIANRFGLVKTLVSTQMLWALFFVVATFVPSGILGVLLQMLYLVLVQMSVPLLASYIMGVVAPGERVAMAGVVLLGMRFLGMLGSVFGPLLAVSVPIAIALFAGAALVIVANAALYRLFRNVKPPEEMERVASDA